MHRLEITKELGSHSNSDDPLKDNLNNKSSLLHSKPKRVIIIGEVDDCIEEEVTPVSPYCKFSHNSKPPIFPHNNNNNNNNNIGKGTPKSILKSENCNISSSTSASIFKRRVSFEDVEEDNFYEPKLHFCGGNSTRNSTHASQMKTLISSRLKEKENERSASPTNSIIVKDDKLKDIESSHCVNDNSLYQQKQNKTTKSPESPHNSPVIMPRLPRDRPTFLEEETNAKVNMHLFKSKKEEELFPIHQNDEITTVQTLNINTLNTTIETLIESTPPISDINSHWVNISVSDVTPSASSVESRRCLSWSRDPPHSQSNNNNNNNNMINNNNKERMKEREVSPVLQGPLFLHEAQYNFTHSPNNNNNNNTMIVVADSISHESQYENSPVLSERYTLQNYVIEKNSAEVKELSIQSNRKSRSKSSRNSMNEVPFEGGVNPEDVVFDYDNNDNNNNNNNTSTAITISPQDRRLVLTIPVQLYPPLVTTINKTDNSRIFPHPSDIALIEDFNHKNRNNRNNNNKIVEESSKHSNHRKIKKNKKDEKKVSLSNETSVTSALHGRNPNSPITDVVNELSLENYLVKNKSQKPSLGIVIMKENQINNFNKIVENKKSDNNLDSVALISNSKHVNTETNIPPKRAKPVVVEYINNISETWKDTLREDDNSKYNQIHSREWKYEPQITEFKDHGELTRNLFPGFFFGNSSNELHINKTNSICEKGVNTSPLIPLRSMEIVSPKPVKVKKSRKTNEVRKNIKNNNNNNNNKSKENEKISSNIIEGETECLEADEFEEIASYGTGSMHEISPNISLSKLEKKQEKEKVSEEILVNNNNNNNNNKSSVKKKTRTPKKQEKKKHKVKSDHSRHKREEVKEVNKTKLNSYYDDEVSRAKRFEKLYSTLLEIEGEKNSFSSPNPIKSESAKYYSSYNNSYRNTQTNNNNNNNNKLQEKENNLQTYSYSYSTSISRPATAEGLIHTPPDRNSLRRESEEVPGLQNNNNNKNTQQKQQEKHRKLCAPTRSTSPVRNLYYNENNNNSNKYNIPIRKETLYNTTSSTIPQHPIENRVAMKLFASEVSNIVRALRDGGLVKNF